jgi:hypothetical protein
MAQESGWALMLMFGLAATKWQCFVMTLVACCFRTSLSRTARRPSLPASRARSGTGHYLACLPTAHSCIVIDRHVRIPLQLPGHELLFKLGVRAIPWNFPIPSDGDLRQQFLLIINYSTRSLRSRRPATGQCLIVWI